MYFLRETLEGGFFYVLESIPNNFSILEKKRVIYGTSGEKYYYNGELINKDSIQ